MINLVTAAAMYWQQQTVNDCVEETVRIAAGVLRHHTLTQQAVDTEAALGYTYNAAVGTPWGEAAPLLRHYGLTATDPAPMSKARLKASLAKGRVVIAAVNAETIWTPASPGSGADHALIITGVNGNTITLCDTGVEGGAAEKVQWSRFSKAWGASGWSAVVAR